MSEPTDHMKRAFRDFVLANKGYGITADAVAIHMPCGATEARKLLRWGVQRGILAEVGPLLVGRRGRPPHVYRYLDGSELPAQPPRRKAAPPEVVARNGAPVAGTGKRRFSPDPEIAALVATAERQGWKASLTGSGHIRLSRSGRPGVTLPQTPSDHRSVENCRAQARRAGIDFGDRAVK